MKFIADSFYIYAEHNTGIYAAELFSEEWKLRTGFLPKMAENAEKANLIFNFNNDLNDKDFFIIDEINSTLRITAKTIRGLIFGYSYFLRKIVFFC